MSKGAGNPCGGSAFAQYASYRPGVYFFARENCYILDIDNQLSKAPDCEAVGTATCGILIKTAPETDDYVKTGLYKTNQSFQVIDATPINGHYKVYYPGNGYSKQTTANTQKIYVDLNAYDVLAYNINGNNYFKLRDVTDALDCRVEWNSRNNMINIITTLPAKEDPNEAKG